MKEEEMMCHHHCWGGKHMYMLLGVLAFAWGLLNYLMVAMGWPAYGAWMATGVFLVLVGWLKKWMYMRMEK